MISVFLSVLRLGLCPNIWAMLQTVSYAFVKNVYSAVVGDSVQHTPVRSRWFIVLFKSCISVLTFCPDVLSIVVAVLFRSVPCVPAFPV